MPYVNIKVTDEGVTREHGLSAGPFGRRRRGRPRTRRGSDRFETANAPVPDPEPAHSGAVV